MIRQLEHRVSTLPELQARLDDERQTALREARRARDTLAAPFKHADALQAAASAVKQIKDAMPQHQPQPARAAPTSMPAPPALRSDATRGPAMSDPERATSVLGQDRAGRLQRARTALQKRFASQAAARDGDGEAMQWRDPQALYWHRRLTTIVEAACCLPPNRSEFGHESDSDLRQLADEALTGARAAYNTPRAGVAHHAAPQAPTHTAQAWRAAPRDRPQIDR